MKRIAFLIGNKRIGQGHPVLIQTRNRKKTSHVKENRKELLPLIPRGLDLLRFSVLDRPDALAFSKRKKIYPIPLIADIHYNPLLAFLAIENGADKVRINPGNFLDRPRLLKLIHLCKEKGIPLRIGVNSGSLNFYKGKGKDHIDDYFLALEDTLQVFKEEGFTHLVLSLKSSSVEKTIVLYQKAYSLYPYPLHVGLTEAGFSLLGARKSTAALLPLLKEGIGDTLRVSLAGDRKEEIRACKELLKLSGKRKDVPDLILCPGCGRRAYDRKPIAEEILSYLDHVGKDRKIAIRGCPVNGLGEAKDSDFGLAGTGRKDRLLFFAKGKEIGVFETKEAIERLKKAIAGF